MEMFEKFLTKFQKRKRKNFKKIRKKVTNKTSISMYQHKFRNKTTPNYRSANEKKEENKMQFC